MTTRAATAGAWAPPSLLEFRVDAPNLDAEDSKAARTHDDAVQVPWPISARTLLDFYYGSPWLGAIGNLLADAVAAADWELVVRDVDVNGQLIQRTEDWVKEADEDYAKARAWLSREIVGREGVSELNLPGLLKAFARVADQTGNVFAEVIRDRGGQGPVQLQNLLPQFVWYEAAAGQLTLRQLDPIRGWFNFVPFGSRGAGVKEQREYLHQREVNSASSYYGIPAWISARDSIEVDNEHRKYLRGFFGRHGTPRYMIEITQDPEWVGAQPSEDQIDAVFEHVRSFLNANAGDMAGRNLIIRYPGGVTVKATALDVKIEDPTFPNTAKNMRDEILAVRHISLLNLGLPEGGYRATADQQATDFTANVLVPFAAPAVAIVNRVLHAPTPSGLGVGAYDFALKFEGVDDLLARIKGVVEAVGGPVLSQVEGRQLMGYEPAGESTVFTPTTMLPGASLQSGGPDGQED